MARILLVGGDPTSASAVSRYLEADGGTVSWVTDGRAALERVELDPPDLVVIDLVPPRAGGLELQRRLAELGTVPLIVLAAGAVDAVGADVLVKPFAPRELLERVRAVVGAAGADAAAASDILRIGDLVVDPTARTATVDGRRVTLTAREGELLAFLVAHPGRTFSREELMAEVWGSRFGDRSTVTVHVRRLRAKIEADPRRPQRIVTVWGEGYRFEP